MMMTFDSRFHAVGMLKAGITEKMVKDEPMLFSASVKFALEHGGPITRSFIHNMPDEYFEDQTATLDTRVHMLMPGWFPCIPGWHHDDVSRNTPTGQPNYDDPAYRTRHVLALVNADIAPTEFAYGPVIVPRPKEGETVYKVWDEAIERTRAPRPAYSLDEPPPPLTFEVHKVADRVLYEFDDTTFHRGTAAVAHGWRWFGRVTIGRKRVKPPEIRRQVQVYMPTINAGW
jgi:hypothetical protein